MCVYCSYTGKPTLELFLYLTAGPHHQMKRKQNGGNKSKQREMEGEVEVEEEEKKSKIEKRILLEVNTAQSAPTCVCRNSTALLSLPSSPYLEKTSFMERSRSELNWTDKGKQFAVDVFHRPFGPQKSSQPLAAETHLVVVDEAKGQGGHLGREDHYDDQEELETQRLVHVKQEPFEAKWQKKNITGKESLTTLRPALDSRIVEQQPNMPKKNKMALMPRMMAAGTSVYLSWMKPSKLS